MKFVYQYRTSDNAVHNAVVSAADRDSAFRKLKALGVKPSRLEEAPGFFNKVLGKGKRWIAIVFLVVVVTVLSLQLRFKGADESYACEMRSQIYGDPATMQAELDSGWTNVFDCADAWFARHAQPGVIDVFTDRADLKSDVAKSLVEHIERKVRIEKGDPPEIAKMKRLINGMRQEMVRYVQGGGTVDDYITLCDQRCRTEANIFEMTKLEFEKIVKSLSGNDEKNIADEWDKKNSMLRGFGLKTIPFPGKGHWGEE